MIEDDYDYDLIADFYYYDDDYLLADSYGGGGGGVNTQVTRYLNDDGGVSG